MIIVKLNACIHVFDSQAARYCKTTTSNLRKALGSSSTNLNRAQILAQIKWRTCSEPNCKVKCCKDQAHLIGS